MSFISRPILPNVDPNFYMLTWDQSKKNKIPDQLLVIAVVSNLQKWKELDGVSTRSEIHSDKNWIITANVKTSEFESISCLDFVKSMEISKPVFINKES